MAIRFGAEKDLRFLHFRISNIGSNELSRTMLEIDEGNLSNFNESLLNNVNLEIISSQRLQSAIGSSTLAYFYDENMIVLSGKEFIYLYRNSFEGKIPLPLGIGSFVKIQFCDPYM